MKRRTVNRGCARIAQQIALAFGIEIDKDVVRRILSAHLSQRSRNVLIERSRNVLLTDSGLDARGQV
ncbi:MAG TPA: hypothetical protein VEX68_24220, partial [Bryobacteraceae bacterium]|nr:hypothetical protein [Bryobacteraceae bacterium]